MKVVTFFARGESAKFIDSLEKPKFTVIANEFGNELEAFPQIGEYIKDSEVHICCNGWPTELDSYKRINFFENYNVTKLMRPYMHDEGRVNIQNSCHLPDVFLSDLHKDWMYQRGVNLPSDFKYEYSYPSTGTATLAYTVLEVAQDGDVVNILGLDFYENSGYLVGTPDATDWGVNGPMQDVLYNLVARHPLITFNMITTARKHLDEVEELQNMNLTRVKV